MTESYLRTRRSQAFPGAAGHDELRPAEVSVPIWFLRIEVEILKGHDEWEETIDRMCLPHAPGDPILRFREAYAV